MKIGYIIAILILAIGCQNVKYPEKPGDLIPEGKMVDVLTEVYLSKAVRSFNIRIVRDQGYKLDSMLYKKFSIDSAQFAKSHTYYSSNIDNYMEMFKKVKTKLEVIKVEADTLKARHAKRRRVRDSIRRDSLRLIEMEMPKDTITAIIPSLMTAVKETLEIQE